MTAASSEARTVTYNVPAGHRIVAYLIPNTAAPAEVDDLAATAIAHAARVGDYPPDDNAAWLQKQLPDPGDWFRLTFVLAAALPIHLMSWNDLVNWARVGGLRSLDEDRLPLAARHALNQGVDCSVSDRTTVSLVADGLISQETGTARCTKAAVAALLDRPGVIVDDIHRALGISARGVERHIRAIRAERALAAPPQASGEVAA